MPELNRQIATAALRGFEVLQEPGSMLHLNFEWAEDDAWKDGVFAPAAPKGDTSEAKYDDDRIARVDTPQYQSQADDAAAQDTHDGEACLVCAGIDF
jgi:hypothetical protein